MATPTGSTPDAVSAASGERQHREQPIGSKCRPDCKRPSPTQAHCSVCHRTFGGVSGFGDPDMWRLLNHLYPPKGAR